MRLNESENEGNVVNENVKKKENEKKQRLGCDNGIQRGMRSLQKGQRKEGKDRKDWLLRNRCMHDTLTMPGSRE